MDKKEFLETLDEFREYGHLQTWVNYNIADRIAVDLYKKDKYKSECLSDLLECYYNNFCNDTFIWVDDRDYSNNYDFEDFIKAFCPKDDAFSYEGDMDDFDFKINGVSVFDEKFDDELEKEIKKCK